MNNICGWCRTSLGYTGVTNRFGDRQVRVTYYQERGGREYVLRVTTEWELVDSLVKQF